MNRPAVAGLDEQRKSTAMVEMRVSEDDGIELAEVHWRQPAIVLIGNFLALVHPHVDHHMGAISLYDVARTSNLARCSKETQLDHRDSIRQRLFVHIRRQARLWQARADRICTALPIDE